VFEDIDCMSDIVNKRDASKTDDEADPDVLHHLNTVLKSSKDVSAESSKYLKDYLKTTGNKKITLSFILNLIDGLHETYGRVLIITSNYFDKLDDAIKRPGRIDITLEMKNVTKNTINEMCKHYYGRHIPMKTMGAIIDYRLSPAEVINIRINSRNFTEFIRNLVKRM
jgi:chaperone BCS1